MESHTGQKLFGSRRRTELLIVIALLGESYPTEIARLLGARLYSIQTIVDELEREGVLATQLRARTRWVRLDSRFYAFAELQALLIRLAKAEPRLSAMAAGR